MCKIFSFFFSHFGVRKRKNWFFSLRLTIEKFSFILPHLPKSSQVTQLHTWGLPPKSKVDLRRLNDGYIAILAPNASLGLWVENIY